VDSSGGVVFVVLASGEVSFGAMILDCDGREVFIEYNYLQDWIE